MLKLLLSYFSRKNYIYAKMPKTVILLDYKRTDNKYLLEELQLKYNLKIIDYFNEIGINVNQEIDFIIVCNDVFYIKLKDPIILADAEIFHSKEVFSKSVFIKALMSYEKCEKRNGK